MKTITKTYELYEFKELEQEIKDKLIEKQTEQEFDWFCTYELEDVMTSETDYLISKNFGGAYDIKTMYSLSYCQGDGVCSEFKISLADLQKKYNIFSKTDIKKIEENSGSIDDILMIVKHDDNFYCHSRTFTIDYSEHLYYSDELLMKFDTLESKVKKDVVSINDELEKEGYSFIEDRTRFEENAKQFLENNENLYFKNGEIFLW